MTNTVTQATERHPLLKQADYVMDQQGNIKGVMLDYLVYQQLEELLLDYGLIKAMEEIIDDEEIDLETAKRLANYEK